MKDQSLLEGNEMLNVPLKSPKERDTMDLINLVCELSGRLSMHANKQLHEAFWEARKELESRIPPPSSILPEGDGERISVLKKDWDEVWMKLEEWRNQSSTPDFICNEIDDLMS